MNRLHELTIREQIDQITQDFANNFARSFADQLAGTDIPRLLLANHELKYLSDRLGLNGPWTLYQIKRANDANRRT